MVCSRSLRARARRPLSAAGVGGAPSEVVLGGTWRGAARTYRRAATANCGALGAACAEPILLLRYMNLYYLITVVNKIIVFLKNNCIS